MSTVLFGANRPGSPPLSLSSPPPPSLPSATSQRTSTSLSHLLNDGDTFETKNREGLSSFKTVFPKHQKLKDLKEVLTTWHGVDKKHSGELADYFCGLNKEEISLPVQLDQINNKDRHHLFFPEYLEALKIVKELNGVITLRNVVELLPDLTKEDRQKVLNHFNRPSGVHEATSARVPSDNVVVPMAQEQINFAELVQDIDTSRFSPLEKSFTLYSKLPPT